MLEDRIIGIKKTWMKDRLTAMATSWTGNEFKKGGLK
jgi:hypothetical protein